MSVLYLFVPIFAVSREGTFRSTAAEQNGLDFAGLVAPPLIAERSHLDEMTEKLRAVLKTF